MMLVAWQFPCRGHRSFFRQLQVIGSVPVLLVVCFDDAGNVGHAAVADLHRVPVEIQTEQDIQQEHGEDQLQLHAQHCQHHQSTQQADLNERNRDRPNNLQLPKKGPMPPARKLPGHQHHL